MSIIKCIKKAGKALSKEDSATLMAQYKKYIVEGLDDAQASKKSLDDLVKGIDAELEGLAAKVEGAGGKVSRAADREPLELEDAQSLAREIAGRIIGTPDGRLPYDYKIGETSPGVFSASTPGAFKKRSFGIPDDLMEEFLENDIEVLASRYIKGTVPHIELTKAFGDPEMKAELKAIDQDYIKKMEDSPEKAKNLGKERDRDIKNLAAMRDRIRGTYGQVDHNNPWVRIGRVSRDLNYMRLLGGVVASSIPDIGRTVMAEGLTKTFVGLGKAIGNIKAFKVAAEEAKFWGVGTDVLMGGRADIIADTADYAAGGTAIERGVRSAATKFSSINMMNYWTGGMKQLHAVVMQNRIGDELTAGRYDSRLDQLGISKDNALGIGEQIAKYGKKEDGNWIFNSRNWDNTAFRDMWGAALKKESDRVIIVPGQEKPLFMSSELGKTIFQFKSFMFSATQRVLISSLQNQDKHTAEGLATLVSFGMLAYAFKEWDAGREISDDPKAWVLEGIDRSGALGYLMEINNTMEKVSNNNVGLRAALGIDSPAGRYASRTISESLIGPTLGSGLSTVGKIATGLTGEDGWRDSDTRAARRLIPMQNLSGFRQIFDELEKKVQ